jgi:hypothetical protein
LDVEELTLVSNVVLVLDTSQDEAVASVLVEPLTEGLEYEYSVVSTGKEVAVASVLVPDEKSEV